MLKALGYGRNDIVKILAPFIGNANSLLHDDDLHKNNHYELHYDVINRDPMVLNRDHIFVEFYDVAVVVGSDKLELEHGTNFHSRDKNSPNRFDDTL